MLIKRQIAIRLFPLFSLLIVKKPKVLSINETMDGLRQGKSLARFGDGELQAISCTINNSFQDNNRKLSFELEKDLELNNPNLMIAIAPPFSLRFSQLNSQAIEYWKPLLLRNWYKWHSILLKQSQYYNAFVTRPYFDFSNNVSKLEIKSVFDRFKSIWLNKRVLIVEGEFSRFGVGDDLLNGCQAIYRIICPSQNAFQSKERIKKGLRDFVCSNPVDIILFSLGQTATVLTCELIDLGIQIIDIGHLDIEYNWFLERAKKKVLIQGKWVNESPQKFVEFDNKCIIHEYYKQIVNTIE